jgi:hypothetical protein
LKLFLEWREQGIKENVGGGIFKNAVFDVLLRTFIITTRYLHPA